MYFKSKLAIVLGLAVLVLIGIGFMKVSEFQDYNFTVIVEGHDFVGSQNRELLKGVKVSEEFAAKNNNLGIVAVKFDTHGRINDDYLQFRIKEIGSGDWYYSNKYKVDQFQNNQYFPFGFPGIKDSKNKKYQIEIESLDGVNGNSVQMVAKGSSILSKHSFPKEYLLEHKEEIIGFVFNKIRSFFGNVSLVNYLLIFVVIYLYIFFFTFKSTKIFTAYLKKLRELFFKIEIMCCKKYEVFIVVVFYILISLILTRLLFYRNMQSQFGDTTFAAQIMLNISKGLGFESSYARSITYSLNDVWYRSAEYVCGRSLITPKEFPPWGHFYLIAFPLGFLLRFFDIYWFIALTQAIIYSTVLLFVYLAARRYMVDSLNSAILVLIASQHPLWLQGFYGQFYFNRFFLLFCSLTILLLSRKKLNYLLISIFSLLAISSNEIYGISLFMVFLVYLFLFKRDKKILIIGLFSLIISLIMITIIKQTAEPGSTQNSVINNTFSGGIISIVVNLYNVIISRSSGIFILVNIIFSGFIILFKPKNFIAWIFFLMPNIMIQIGKLAWSTHYHISYFVPTLWLFVYSVSLIKFKNKVFLTLFLFGYLVFISKFNVDNYKIGESSYVFDKIYKSYETLYLSRKGIIDKFMKFQSSVGINDMISLPEALAYPFLKQEIFYYPVELDGVDKVIMLFDKNKIGDARFYSINYGQQAENWDTCILARMRKNNFDLDNPQVIENVAVIGKLPKR
ncbi:MAG: hypothetical protein WC841_01705 [Candidatus Shapirobacteria bacterium]|jgi:hypothetical protein